MGDASLSYDAETDLESITVTGEVSAADIIGVTHQKGFGTGRKKLWDFSRSDLSGITTEDVISVLERFKELDATNKAQATAVVVKNQADEVLINLFKATSKDILNRTMPIHVTTSKSDALEWLEAIVQPKKQAS